jgi:hypothetical protein
MSITETQVPTGVLSSRYVSPSGLVPSAGGVITSATLNGATTNIETELLMGGPATAPAIQYHMDPNGNVALQNIEAVTFAPIALVGTNPSQNGGGYFLYATLAAAYPSPPWGTKAIITDSVHTPHDAVYGATCNGGSTTGVSYPAAGSYVCSVMWDGAKWIYC